MVTKLTSHKKRTASSRKWLVRQINDPYVAKAAEQGWRSRAAFKLMDIDAKYKVLKAGQRVLDLGAAPGGWTQVAVKKTGAKDGGGSGSRGGFVLAIDLQPMEPVTGAQFIHSDFALVDWSAYADQPFDVILSDMAASACGIASVDHLRIMRLIEIAYDLAKDHLAPGGHFVAKVLRGGLESGLLKQMKHVFASVHHYKPPSSRADSAEMYLVALGYKGKKRA